MPLFTFAYLCLPLFTLPLFTFANLCLPLFTFVNLCSNDASMHKFCACLIQSKHWIKLSEYSRGVSINWSKCHENIYILIWSKWQNFSRRWQSNSITINIFWKRLSNVNDECFWAFIISINIRYGNATDKIFTWLYPFIIISITNLG